MWELFVFKDGIKYKWGKEGLCNRLRWIKRLVVCISVNVDFYFVFCFEYILDDVNFYKNEIIKY